MAAHRFNYSVIFSLFFVWYLSACGSAPVNPKSLPKGMVINKNVQYPVDVPLVVYAPQSHLKSSFFVVGQRVEPGRALAAAIANVTSTYFSNTKLLNLKSDEQYGLLLDLDPDWEIEHGEVQSIIKYRWVDANGNVISEGTKEYKMDMNYQNHTVGFQNAATRVLQVIIAKFLNKYDPMSRDLSARKAMKSIDPASLVNLETPVSSGTGFFINKTGQILTAAHVINECLITKAQIGDKITMATTQYKSNLLDVAVLSTETPATSFLTIRKKPILKLGEKVTTVSYPLKGLLEASPNLTIGNVSSKNGTQRFLRSFPVFSPYSTRLQWWAHRQ
ncbi:MAG: serine protease [Enterobacterales bacterium]|nr:serine protease [Enterobacterales bacterium]